MKEVKPRLIMNEEEYNTYKQHSEEMSTHYASLVKRYAEMGDFCQAVYWKMVLKDHVEETDLREYHDARTTATGSS